MLRELRELDELLELYELEWTAGLARNWKDGIRGGYLNAEYAEIAEYADFAENADLLHLKQQTVNSKLQTANHKQ